MAESKANTRSSDRLEREYMIREVTHMQASWTEGKRGEPGKFTLQLILDHGVDEYVLEPDSDDIDLLLTLFGKTGRAMFDINRKVLMFGNIGIKG